MTIKKRLRANDRTLEIIVAALTCAQLKGFSDFRAEDVGAIAKCSTALVFYHFTSMDLLREQVMHKAIADRNLRVLADGLFRKYPVALRAPRALRDEALRALVP